MVEALKPETFKQKVDDRIKSFEKLGYNELQIKMLGSWISLQKRVFRAAEASIINELDKWIQQSPRS